MSPVLPKAIQRQLKAVEAIEAQISAQAENPPAPTPGIAEVLDAPPPAPTAQAPAPATPAPPQPSLPPADTTDWRQKFLTLQGVFNTEMPKLQGQVRELMAKNEEAHRRAQAPTPAPAPQAQPDQKDIDGFGIDMVNMVRRTAETMLAPVLHAFDLRIKALEAKAQQLETTTQGAAQVASRSAEDMFFARLEKLVPNWEQVNGNQAFLQWLTQVDPIYGQTRQSALDAARQSLNADRAASVFNTFASSVVAPVAPTPSPLANQQAPSASGGSAPPPQVAKPTFTEKQVTDFYNDKARNKYRGKEAEAARIEEAINLAAAEGRIR